VPTSRLLWKGALMIRPFVMATFSWCVIAAGWFAVEEVAWADCFKGYCPPNPNCVGNPTICTNGPYPGGCALDNCREDKKYTSNPPTIFTPNEAAGSPSQIPHAARTCYIVTPCLYTLWTGYNCAGGVCVAEDPPTHNCAQCNGMGMPIDNPLVGMSCGFCPP